MADEIEIGSKAIKQIQQLKDELLAADQALLKLSQNALQAGKNIGGISTPGGLGKAGADNAKTSAELETLKAKYISLNDTIVKKAEQSRLAEIKLQQAREKSFDSFEKNAQKEAALVEKNNNAYNKTQQQINRLTVAYNDLAARKERYNNLSANEEMRLKTLQSVTEKYNGTLKSIDATIGKNQRNVGNYASGYNALGNSINQLTREAPAFANSVQTGFMAISNNFAALQDAIKGIREQNKALAAEGKPTVSVLKQLASGFFSWTTLISVGITLLTVYGAKIVESISGSKKKKEALDKEKEALEEKTRAEEKDRDVISSKQADEISRSQLLFEKAKNLTLTYKERTEAVKDLKERYPDFLKGLSDEKILAGETAEAEEKLNLALINRGFALAAQEKIQENLKKELDLRLQYGKVSEKALEIRNKESLQSQELIVYTDKEDRAKQQKAENERKQILEQDRLYSVKLNNLQAERATLIDVYNENSKYIGSVKESNKQDKISNKEKRDEIQSIVSLIKAKGTLIEEIDKQIDALTTENIVNAGNTEEHAKTTKQLKQLLEVRKNMNALPVAPLLDIKTPFTPEDVETVKQMSDEVKNYLSSFSSEFMSNSGFAETFKLLNGDIEDFEENFAVAFNAIAESAQEAFNFISNASQQNFDAERDRLQSQYEVSLAYAGDNKAAQEKLATDLEKQKKEIANREAKAKQKQAIFNIAIDTAQAIMGLWAKPGFPAAIPLAIAVGALGAIQIGLVASQEIPQYWMGGTHDGGLMMVNDGKGSNFQETIVTPDGKIMQPKGRNVIMDAPAGTEIYTQEQWNNTLNDMLQGKGISMSVSNKTNSNGGATAQQIDSIMAKHFSKIALNNVSFDVDGMRVWSERNGNKTISTSNRVVRTGIKV